MAQSEEAKFTFWLLFSTVICVLGNSFLYGYQIGVVNTPSGIIQEFYNKTYYERRGGNWSTIVEYENWRTSLNLTGQYSDKVNLTELELQGAIKEPKEFGADLDLLLRKWELDLLWSSTVAAFVLFGMIGAFLSGRLADTVGRKKGMIVITVLMFVAAILGGITVVVSSPECLIASRVLVGLHSGLNISLASLYLSEISPKKIRGAIGTCHQLAITIGILVAQIFGIKEIFGTRSLWPYLFAFNALPSLICLGLMPLCPESPRFLLIKQGKKQEAHEVMKRLRGTDNVQEEMDEMQEEASHQTSNEQFSIKQLMTTPELRLPTVIACLIQVTQQWSGINAVMSYSSFIFKQAQVDLAFIPYVVVGTGTINVVATIIAVPLMEKAGRRPLLLWPMCVMAVSFLLMTIFLNLQFNMDLLEYHSAFAMVCILLMHIYIVGFALGLGPIPFIVVGEIFRQAPRAAAMSISLAFNWVCNFILMLTFPFLKDGLQAYTYLLFTIILVAAIIFIFYFVPETKGRTFDEIARSLAFGRPKGQSQGYTPNEAELQRLDSKPEHI